ncbi:MAG TPA: fibronectin type III-like domain-contianing protein, partial [Puia sp.]
AEAIGDVLLGDYNPDGRLPYSYPRSMGEMVLYDRKPTEDIREIFNSDMTMNGYYPLYPFGWGLSYTRWTYGELQLGSGKLAGTGKLTVSVTVTNSGSRDGKHTVELYTRQHYASITPNMRRLRAFKKIFLKAGQSETVSFTLDRNDLAFVNAKLKTVTEPGEFDVLVGDKKAVFSYAAQ